MYSKELLKGTLSPIILSLLSENGKMYGYEIFMKVKDLSDGKIILKDGSLYPILQKMHKEGLLTFEEVSIGKRIRKYYYLTAQGEQKKRDCLAELKDFMNTINLVVFQSYKTT
ncbi:MAG: PadR family transcriptional regulator PadR [Cryomorphaceae bacterium]|jgi:PadR family transcriptional regulator PadR